MRIIDLAEEHKDLFCCCLEDWSDEAAEGAPRRLEWYERMKDEGLYKEGRGNFQGKGMGKALLAAAEEDARELGAKGMAAWGLSLPFWMRAKWFKRRGYQRVDKAGAAVLMWKPFEDGGRPPRWIKERKRPKKVPGRVSVVAFTNGCCMAQNLVVERAKRASAEVGNKVVFEEIDTLDKDKFMEWGISDGLFIDGKQVRTGPPPTYKKIRKLITKRARKLPVTGSETGNDLP
jgi:GNAT superfamily N-acetyltransferase